MSTQKVILITGANAGLGREIVKDLLQSNITYSIVVGSRKLDNAAATIKDLSTDYPASKSTLDTVQIDIEDDASIESACAYVSEKYGRLDALVNNAGKRNILHLMILECSLSSPGAQFDQQIQQGKMTAREAWNQSWNVNTTGSHITTTAFVPLLLKSDDPRLLFITSGTSTLARSENTAMPFNKSPAKGWPKDIIPLLNIPAYRSAKAGMNMPMLYDGQCTCSHPCETSRLTVLSEWHRILGEDGVKTWCVSPGYLATGLGGSQEVNKKQGAVDPSVGASLVRRVLEGERDGDVGKVVSDQGIQAW